MNNGEASDVKKSRYVDAYDGESYVSEEKELSKYANVYDDTQYVLGEKNGSKYVNVYDGQPKPDDDSESMEYTMDYEENSHGMSR